MNKYYLIAPIALLAAFLFTPGGGYFAAQKQIAEKNAKLEAERAAIKAAEDKRKAEVAQRATEDAAKRQREREEQDRKKAEDKEKAYADAMTKLKDEADGYKNEADKLAKESADLELQLGNLRTQKEKANRDSFELAKKVELAKIDRRNAELEIQRMVEMVSTKVGVSSFTALPPPPAPPAK